MTQNQNQEDKEQSNKEESTSSKDPFDRLMFGNRSRTRALQESDEVEDPTNMPVDQVDFAQLMKQADDIMNSINKIKPVFKELSPLLDFFRKK